MGSEWPMISFGEISEGIYDGPHATPKKADSGHIFLRIDNLHRGGLDLSDIRWIDEDDWPRWTKRVTPQADDIVFSYEANLGLFALIPDGFDGCLGRRLALIRPDKSKVDARYLLYACLSPTFQDFLQSRTVYGSTVNRISLKEFPTFEIPLPPLPEQRAIAGVLGSLDDKIELNRRMNRTLESMARAWFKSWFVDFDPVHANAAGTPDSWQEVKLADVADVVSGGTPRKSNADLWNGDIPWVSPKSMDSIHVTDTDQRVTEAAVGNGTKEVAAGAVFVMVRGMGLHDGVRISQSRGPMTFNQDVKAIVPRNIDPTLLLFALLHSQPTLHHSVRSSGHGTGVLPTEAIAELSLTMPPPDEAKTFAEQLHCLNERIVVNDAESRTLASLRDALLPKLLSGEMSGTAVFQREGA